MIVRMPSEMRDAPTGGRRSARGAGSMSALLALRFGGRSAVDGLRTLHAPVRLLLALFLACLAGLAAMAEADAKARRVALVIGNARYQHAPVLKNPMNDAEDMARKLKLLGFEVISGTNSTRQEMVGLLARFKRELEGAEVGLLFYAGHGFQKDGKNYLVPVEVPLEDAELAEYSTIELQFVIEKIQDNSRTTLIFLDACRDNPWSSSRNRGGGGGNRGLARVDAGRGTYIAFATSPGDTAADGEGRNSPFTAALLNHIETPNVSLPDLMIRVRNEVINATKGDQEPYEEGKLTATIYLKEEVKPAPLTSEEQLSKLFDSPEYQEKLARQGEEWAQKRIQELIEQQPPVAARPAEPAQRPAIERLEEKTAGDPSPKSGITKAQGRPEDDARPEPEQDIAALTPHAPDRPIKGRQDAPLSESAQEPGAVAMPSGSVEHGQTAGPPQKAGEIDAASGASKLQGGTGDDVSGKANSDKLRLAAVDPTAIPLPQDDATAERVIDVVKATEGEPDEAEDAAPAEAPDEEDVTRELQEELERAKCAPGGVDGKWGPGSRKALERFSADNGLELDASRPTPEALEALRGAKGGLCKAAPARTKAVADKRDKPDAASSARSKDRAKDTAAPATAKGKASGSSKAPPSSKSNSSKSKAPAAAKGKSAPPSKGKASTTSKPATKTQAKPAPTNTKKPSTKKPSTKKPSATKPSTKKPAPPKKTVIAAKPRAPAAPARTRASQPAPAAAAPPKRNRLPPDLGGGIGIGM